MIKLIIISILLSLNLHAISFDEIVENTTKATTEVSESVKKKIACARCKRCIFRTNEHATLHKDAIENGDALRIKERDQFEVHLNRECACNSNK